MSGSGEAASYGDLLVTSLVVLGGVCIAAFVAVRVLGRFLSTGRTRGAQLLDVVARVPLEPRRSLYVVDVAGKTLLVGTSEMGLSVLTELDRAAVQSRVVVRPTFADLVKTAWQKRRAKPLATVSEPTRPAGKPAIESALESTAESAAASKPAIEPAPVFASEPPCESASVSSPQSARESPRESAPESKDPA